jgi:hypothetical protein
MPAVVAEAVLHLEAAAARKAQVRTELATLVAVESRQLTAAVAAVADLIDITVTSLVALADQAL